MPGLSLGQLMRMPWNYQGPRRVVDEGEEHWELRIEELPDFFVAGRSHEEVLNDTPDALRTFLESYLLRGETPPTPTDPDRWKISIHRVPKAEKVGVTVIEAPRPASTVGAAPEASMELVDAG